MGKENCGQLAGHPSKTEGSKLQKDNLQKQVFESE